MSDRTAVMVFITLLIGAGSATALAEPGEQIREQETFIVLVGSDSGQSP